MEKEIVVEKTSDLYKSIKTEWVSIRVTPELKALLGKIKKTNGQNSGDLLLIKAKNVGLELKLIER